ncbi:kinase-like domain-containing protein [Daedaleopsis nitida]|nr:kinase-like domain-containing protein [Daedaleopsis nitida]
MSHPRPVRFPDFTGKIIDGAGIRLVKKLGQGSFGVVYRAVNITTNSPLSSSSNPHHYAVKIVMKEEANSWAWLLQQREISAQMHVRDHPNVAYIHATYECDEYIYIVLEHCEGDLLDAIFEQDRYSHNEALLKSIFVQLLDAVDYCHQRGVYHRDLKPENILTSKDGTVVKLTDFGLSTTVNVSDGWCTGSLDYMSPECLGEDYNFQAFSTQSSDVWSLGVILTNLIARSFPWKMALLSNENYLYYLANPSYLREMLPISEQAAEILKAIFNPDPIARITIPELRELVLNVDTFFMCDEDIASGNEHLQETARYMDRAQAPPIVKDDLCNAQATAAPSWDPSFVATSVPFTSNGGFGAFGDSSDSESESLFGDRWRYDSDSSFEGASRPRFDSESSSDDDGQGLFTPETRPQDASDLENIPELAAKRKISDDLVASMTLKDDSMPSAGWITLPDLGL